MANLHVALLRWMGIGTERLADSTGELAGLYESAFTSKPQPAAL
jgi:hypothetical protein